MTLNERNFLERGGSILCMRRVGADRWEIFRKTWESEELFSVRPSTEESTIRWIFVLMDLAKPEELLAVHHSVPRTHEVTDPRLAPLL